MYMLKDLAKYFARSFTIENFSNIPKYVKFGY